MVTTQLGRPYELLLHYQKKYNDALREIEKKDAYIEKLLLLQLNTINGTTTRSQISDLHG